MTSLGKAWRFACLLVVGVGAVLAPSVLASDKGQEAANQVNLAGYQNFLNNYLYTHTGQSRGPSGAQHDPARDNIRSLFLSYGLSTAFETFTYNSQTWENVVATKTGTVYPSRIYIIGAHYDSASVPGADDNASGVAGVLEAARIISQYPSDCTIRFIAFDMEEAGLIGSTDYAGDHAAEDIRGMLSLDMIAYDTGTNSALIYGRTASNPIKTALASAISSYSGGLSYTIGGQLDQSDHAPFESRGFQACLLIEGEVWSNPYYHTSQDNYENPNNLNFNFAVKMVRSVVGWLVDNAGVQVPVNTLDFAYPNGLPGFVAPLGGTRVRVEVTGVGSEVPQPGTAQLHYRIGAGSWQLGVMETVADNVYDAVFPAAACGETVSYYVTAQSTTAQTYFDPDGAPTSAYTATAAYGEVQLFLDQFETDQGWTVGDTGDTATTGLWSRNVPQATAAQPGEDHTPAPGTMCWVTDYRAGSSIGQYDVDGGKTTLKSPIFNWSGYSSVMVRYWRWYSNDQGAAPNADTFRVDISNNGGSTWVNAETVGPSGYGTSGGWIYHEFDAADVLALTSQMRLRFIAEDAGDGSIIEAALDDFEVVVYDCTPPFVPGDMNCDGLVNNQDIDHFVQALFDATGYVADHDGDPYPVCDILGGDFTGDGLVNNQDISGFIAVLFG